MATPGDAPSFWQNGTVSILWNVVGGAVVAGGATGLAWFRRRWEYRKFRAVFGADVPDGICLKYAAFQLPRSDIILKKHPTIVPRQTHGATNLTDVTSEANMRAIGYLAYTFGKSAGVPPVTEADHKADDRMDISFIATGGVVNHRSYDLFTDPANIFLMFNGASGSDIVTVQNRQVLATATPLTEGHDFGLIVKINPSHNPKRTWIWCAGFRDWGMSGAAWFLAHHWQDIYKWAKGAPFACVTQTKTGSDDSTKLIARLYADGGIVKVITMR